MDESDRLTQFIEDRAKDTLLRFTRMRQQRHIMSRYSNVAMRSPVTVGDFPQPLTGHRHARDAHRFRSTRMSMIFVHPKYP